jgi:hypothetical protein
VRAAWRLREDSRRHVSLAQIDRLVELDTTLGFT